MIKFKQHFIAILMVSFITIQAMDNDLVKSRSTPCAKITNLFWKTVNKAQEAFCSKKQLEDKPKFFIINESELDTLLEKYKKPIVIKYIPNIKKIKLTKKCLKHVFGMEIKQKENSLKDFYITGFHHDYNLELEDQIKPYYRSGSGASAGVREVFIAYRRDHLEFPVFKTFFSHMLTREQVIEKLIESLQNIQEYENQGNKIKIRGKASVLRKEGFEDIIIDTVINSDTNEIITFFPVTQKTEEEVAEETARYKLLFKKFFYNIEKKAERKPITEDEIEQLTELYSDGIEVNWVLAQFDSYTKVRMQVFASTLHILPPYWQDVLFKKNKLNKVLEKYGQIINQKSIQKINITAKSIENIFTSDNDSAFPKYLTRIEMLEKLKEALQKITIYPDGYFKEKNMNLATFKGIGNFLILRSFSNGIDEKDIWNFLIIINEDTGDLETFYPLFI